MNSNSNETAEGASLSDAGLGDAAHWADGAPETLDLIKGKFFYADMEDESRAVLDKLAEFERQRNAARGACRLALNAFERGDCIDWEIVAAQASPNEPSSGAA